MLIAIDNGHGYNTAGKRTPPFPDTGKVIREWEFNYPTAKKLGELLKKNGFDVIYVSDTKEDTPLSTRTTRANTAKADLFVSIHYNAYKGVWGTHGGIDTFHFPNSVEGKKVAAFVQNEIIRETGLRNRGVKSANFYVLRKTTMPAILVECGFMDNLQEAKLMLNELHQMNCARGIAKGICKYFNVKYSETGNVVRVKIKDKLYIVEGYLKNGSNYVGIRELAEKLGYKVSWDNATKTVIIK